MNSQVSDTIIDMEIEDNATALCRLIGTIRRRDFEIVHMEARQDGPLLRTRMTVRGKRCARHLTRQIERLIDVRSVAAEYHATLAIA